MAKSEAPDTKVRIQIKNTEVSVDILSFGKGLNLGQLEEIETEFGVDVGDVQNMNFKSISIKAMSAWVYGLLLPKLPSVTPDDVRGLSLEEVTGWFTKFVEAAAPQEDEAPLDEGAESGDGAPQETSSSSAQTGDPVKIPESSGGPG